MRQALFVWCGLLLLLFAGARAAEAPADAAPRPESVTFKKSWIKTGRIAKTDNPGTPWVEGDELSLPIEYYVDKSDDWGKTRIKIWVVGPWIDNPDGKYTKHRHHELYPDADGWVDCRIGEPVKTVFKMKVPRPFTANPPEKGKFGDGGIVLLQFVGADGKNWPVAATRVGFGSFTRKDAYFDLDAPTPGNLFTYEQPVVMQARLGNLAAGGGAKTLRYRVTDVYGQEAAAGEIAFTAEKPGQVVDIPLSLKGRGTFLLHAAVDGWEAREVTFATIPDVEKIIGDKPTHFGGQKFCGQTEAVKAARMLGMSTCRVWFSWKEFNPLPGQFNDKYAERVGKQLDELNAHHIRPWIMFDYPPVWAVKGDGKFGKNYTPFAFDDKELEAVVTEAARRFKGKISGFEWQNEIVPGDVTPNPVEDYARFCKVASAAVKKIDPSLKNQMAGGLWPRSFRKALLAQGIADAIDILPVHYSSGGGIEEARGDLAAVGAADKPVWDNETARGFSTWAMPLSEAMQYRGQSDYYLDRLSSELAAGCPQMVIFGGEGDNCGNWSHFWGDMSPRPSAATLALLGAKLGTARALGEFSLGGGSVIRLFANGDKPVMVALTSAAAGETVKIPAGVSPLTAIDNQGNEKALPAAGGLTELALTPSAYFVEGGDLEILEAQLVAKIAAKGSGVPQLSFVKGSEGVIPLLLTNFYDKPLTVTATLRAGDAPGAVKPLSVTLRPGEKAPAVLKFTAEKEGMSLTAVEIAFDDPRLPQVNKAVGISVIDPDAVGNLLQNPGFEDGEGEDVRVWTGAGVNGIKRVPHGNADELGHNGHVLSFTDTQNYGGVNQVLSNLTPGEYVYSMWIKSEGLSTGSNVNLVDAAGNKRQHNWLRIFSTPSTHGNWEVFTSRVKVGEDIKEFHAEPIACGKGVSWIDNASLTFYEGTEYNASAPKAPGTVTIDGDLSDFNRMRPLPLIGRNQLRAEDKGYQWTPRNLSAVAWFNWDAVNLYVGVEVIDDAHCAAATGDACVQGDSLEIAFHPLNRQPGEDGRAFVYYLSSANPGGGSGKHTVFRPAERCGGLRAGQLAKDSSQYEIAVRRDGNRTVYEIAMPFSELGGIVNALGTKFGLSLALNDNDGGGRAASMLWGEGLRPAWSPENFGMMVLVDK